MTTGIHRSGSLPFTDEQVQAAVDMCCAWEPAADADLAREVLRVVAEKMDRDEQYTGMYGPLRKWRLAGPWVMAEGRHK